MYKERLEDLQGLCWACHDFIHAKSNRDPLRRAYGRKIRVKEAGKGRVGWLLILIILVMIWRCLQVPTQPKVDVPEPPPATEPSKPTYPKVDASTEEPFRDMRGSRVLRDAYERARLEKKLSDQEIHERKTRKDLSK
jgi:hypothetical protein